MSMGAHGQRFEGGGGWGVVFKIFVGVGLPDFSILGGG